MIERLPLLVFLPGLVASAVIAVLAGWAVWHLWPRVEGTTYRCTRCVAYVPSRQADRHDVDCALLAHQGAYLADYLLGHLDLAPYPVGVPAAEDEVEAAAHRVARHYRRAERIHS